MDSRGDGNSTEIKWDEEASKGSQLEAQDLLRQIKENNAESIICLATICVLVATAVIALFK